MASSFPHAILQSKGLKLLVYLPDPTHGFYRSTRFDWSGMIGSAEYHGHKYFGPWRTPHDPTIYEHGIGPCEEFGLEDQPPLWETAADGGTFVKIAVGILRKPSSGGASGGYQFTFPYEIVEPGQWKITIDPTMESIEFEQVLEHNGVGYRYNKKVEISPKNAGEFNIIHTLENTGSQRLTTTHYNHAFIRVDDKPIGPDYIVQLPFECENAEITIEQPGYGRIVGRTIQLIKDLPSGVALWTPLVNSSQPSSSSSSSSSVVASESKFVVIDTVGDAGVRMSIDKPALKFNFYAVNTAACPEPFISIDVSPSERVMWTTTVKLGNAKSVTFD